MKQKKLSPKRIAFVNEYLQCWNASEAARRVGYSAKTANSAGSFLLRIPEVLREIEERQRNKGMSADEALARLADQARGSIIHFIHVTSNGMIEFDFSTQEALDNIHLIKKVCIKRKRVADAGVIWEHEWIEVELHDAQAALVLLGRHHRLFTDRADVDLTLNVEGLDAMLDKVYGDPHPKAIGE